MEPARTTESINKNRCTSDARAPHFTRNTMTGSSSFSFKKASLSSAGWTQKAQQVTIINFTGTHTNIRHRRVRVDVQLSAILYTAKVQQTTHHSSWAGLTCSSFSTILIRRSYARTKPLGSLKWLKHKQKKPAPEGRHSFKKTVKSKFLLFFFSSLHDYMEANNMKRK